MCSEGSTNLIFVWTNFPAHKMVLKQPSAYVLKNVVDKMQEKQL